MYNRHHTETLKRLITDIVVVGDAAEHRFCAEVLERSGVSGIHHLSEKEYEEYLSRLPHEKRGSVLALKRFPGNFARECPGTGHPYLCCRYETLSPAVNCPLGCTYCILQSYLNEPVNVIYVNWAQLARDAYERYARTPSRLIRTGTGELSDSLVFEPWTRIGERLIEEFGNKAGIILELKTKTVAIESVLALPAPGNVVLSWSLNPESIVKREEGYAAPVAERITAARQAVEAGYLVGFHFDPIIHMAGGTEQYRELARELFDSIPASRIAWISLGCLRYPGELLAIARIHQRQSRIFSAEMIRGLDGKWRYPRPIRQKEYRAVAEIIRERAPEVFLYLCMELPAVWRNVLGWSPANNNEFDKAFRASLLSRYENLQ